MGKNKTMLTAEAGKQEVFVEREFNFPREKIFQAFIDPKLYIKWLGPLGYEMKLEKFEPVAGGSYRYIHSDTAGNKFAFHGVNHSVIEPELLISTFEFEGLPEKGHVSLDTAYFEELPNGRTKLTIHSVFQSVADRDGMIKADMERGMREGFERLDELLLELQK